MKKELKNQVCLIIGGSRGIGLALSKHLYNLGGQIIIASKNKNNARKAALSINSSLENVSYFKIEVTSQKEIKKIVDEIVNKFGKIDVLICSAGIFEPIGPFTSVPFEEHKRTIETNLIGTMNCCYAVLPEMMKNKKGKIILFSGSGIGGDVPLEHASSYFISKGGLALFSEVLAAELKPFNVQINSVLPGRILTDLTKATLNISQEKLGKVLSKASDDLRKTGGQSIEPVLELVTFLCSKESNRISGKLLSAKWDKVQDLLKTVPFWKYTLKRIEGGVYKRNGK